MLSVPHLIVIFVVALVVFGPEKLPELARNVGKFMAEFRRISGEFRSTFDTHMRDLEREAEERRRAAAASTAAPAPTQAATAIPATDSPNLSPNEPVATAEAGTEVREEVREEMREEMREEVREDPGYPTPTAAQGIVPSADPRIPREPEASAESSIGTSHAAPAEESGYSPEHVTDGEHHPI